METRLRFNKNQTLFIERGKCTSHKFSERFFFYFLFSSVFSYADADSDKLQVEKSNCFLIIDNEKSAPVAKVILLVHEYGIVIELIFMICHPEVYN